MFLIINLVIFVLIERIPYLLSIPLVIILIIILKKFEKIILLLLRLLFIFGAIVSFYHFGIEQGFLMNL